jgi:hypothetical protein
MFRAKEVPLRNDRRTPVCAVPHRHCRRVEEAMAFA